MYKECVLCGGESDIVLEYRGNLVAMHHIYVLSIKAQQSIKSHTVISTWSKVDTVILRHLWIGLASRRKLLEKARRKVNLRK